MNGPTDAQTKEFWEWCGAPTLLDDMQGGRRCLDIDLNNLFEYAVPKVRKLYGEIFIEFAFRDNYVDCCIRHYPGGSGYESWVGTGQEDWQALFRALWRVKEALE